MGINPITCSHHFKIIKEVVQTKVDFLGGRRRIKIVTIQCENCGDLGFRELPAGDDEK